MKSIPLAILLATVATLQPLVAEDTTLPAKTASVPVTKAYKDADVSQFEKLRASEPKPVVLDVRTPEEFAAGHIPGSILLDFRSPKFGDEIAKLPRDKPYLVHCAVGGRSAKACEKMSQIGFTNLVNLKGGFKAWQAEGKPVEK